MAELPSLVAIAGAGTMGAGMALVFAEHGCDVRLTARSPDRLAAVHARLAPATAARVEVTTDLEHACAGAELVVETISEQVEPKQELLRRAERVAAADAVLVSNTSSLPLAPLASVLRRPERFAGFHWFNPPDVVEAVEVIGAPATEPGVLASLAAWARALGKTPVAVRRDVPGFIANRLQYALLREAWALVQAGVCDFADVDVMLTHGLGARWAAIGPFQAVDLAGLDIHLAVARNLFGELSTASEPPSQLEAIVARGSLGCKSGHGLLGTYDPAAVERLTQRRDSMLRAIARERDDLVP